MSLQFFIFIIFLLILIRIGEALTLHVLTHIDSTKFMDVYGYYRDEFNEYSRNNGLGIDMDLQAYTKENSTTSVEGYEATLSSELDNQSTTYDMFFYDNIFTKNFGPYLLPLDDYIDPKFFDLYKDGVSSEMCLYNNKWVALPSKVDATFLYCNQNVLQKYNKTVPSTWEELRKTAKEVLEKERKLNNQDFVAYNGLFCENEMGTCSLLEFIHSFRENLKDPFPPIKGKAFSDALIMMKTLKNDIASNDIFSSTETRTEKYFDSGNFLCQKYWYRPYLRKYIYVPLPGRTKPISGSTLGGFNLGINRYIDEDHRKAAIIAFKYMMSKANQKVIAKKYGYFSAMPSVYDDNEVCSDSDIRCDSFKNTQLIARPTDIYKDYTNYSDNMRKYIYAFLYEDASLKDTIQSIYDISVLHRISLSFDESFIGLFNVIIITSATFIMICSLFFLCNPRYTPYLQFLPEDFWVISVIGSCIMLYSLYGELGNISVLKCHVRSVFLTFGFTLSFIPVCYKLIVDFPKKNRFSSWVYRHRHCFLLIFMAMDIICYAIYFKAPFNIVRFTSPEGKMFDTCRMENPLTINVIYAMVFFRVMIVLFSAILIFMEWDLEETRLDLKFLVPVIISDFIYGVIMFIDLIKIQSINFLYYYIIFSVIVLLFAISNYVFIYGVKLILPFLSSRNQEEDDNHLKFQKVLCDNTIGGNFNNLSGSFLTISNNSQNHPYTNMNKNSNYNGSGGGSGIYNGNYMFHSSSQNSSNNSLDKTRIPITKDSSSDIGCYHHYYNINPNQYNYNYK